MRFYELYENQFPGLGKKLLSMVPPKLSGIPEAELIEAFNTFLQGHTPGNVQQIAGIPPNDALYQIRDTLIDIERRFSSGEILVYRSLTVNKSWLQTLTKPNNRLGIHWTYNENMTMSHLGYDEDDDEQDDPYIHVTLCAGAPITSIDWGATIPELADGVECEIVLKSASPIELSWSDPEPNGLIEEQQLA